MRSARQKNRTSPLPQVGRGTSRPPTGSAHTNGGAAKVKKRLSLAARHRFFGQAPKKWGRIAAEANDHLPTYRRTSTKPKKRRHLICAFYVCAVFLGRSPYPLLPIPPHFFALAQRNGVEPQRNALLGAATVAVWSRPPLPRTRSPNIPADCVKLTLPGQLTNQPQVNLTHQFVPLWLRAEWERWAGPPSSCGGFKALFFGGSTPFLWASTKEMGSKGRTS